MPVRISDGCVRFFPKPCKVSAIAIDEELSPRPIVSRIVPGWTEAYLVENRRLISRKSEFVPRHQPDEWRHTKHPLAKSAWIPTIF
jgi:hypothetical protein